MQTCHRHDELQPSCSCSPPALLPSSPYADAVTDCDTRDFFELGLHFLGRFLARQALAINKDRAQIIKYRLTVQEDHPGPRVQMFCANTAPEVAPLVCYHLQLLNHDCVLSTVDT